MTAVEIASTVTPFRPTRTTPGATGRGVGTHQGPSPPLQVSMPSTIERSIGRVPRRSAVTIGTRCQLSKGAGIGARSEIVEGVVVGKGSVVSMGVYLGQSTKIYDRGTGDVSYGYVPPGSVVVPGNLPSADGKYSLYCAVIVKHVDAKTRAKTSLNELLRNDE